MNKHKLPKPIKGFIEYHLENYNASKEELRQYHSNDFIDTQVFSLETPSRHRYFKELERITHAIATVLNKLPDVDKQIIEDVYINQARSKADECFVVNMPARTVHTHINCALYAIAVKLGFIRAEM